MLSSHTSYKFTTPYYSILNAFFVLLFALLISILVYEVNSLKEMQHIVHSDFKAAEIRANVQNAEERIAMSIRMAVITKDKKWQDKYLFYNSILHNALNHAAQEPSLNYSNKSLSQIFSDTDKINSLQEQAYNLFTQGNIDSAKKIIFSNDYSEQRNIYFNKMADDQKTLESESHFHLQNKIRSTHYFISSSIFASLLLMIIWFFTYKNIQRLRKIKTTEQQLEESFYYNHLQAIHKHSALTASAPPAFMEMQNNRDLFMAELKYALEAEQFTLFYQPIVNPISNRIVDVEVLLRWQHPTYGLISPDLFLPLCETTDFILKLGEWVLNTACQQIQKWFAMGHTTLSIAINLSARQLSDPKLITFINNIIEKTHLPPACIKLEITESMIMKDINTSIKMLSTLSQYGFQLSLDDFGTGHSSLNYLKQFPFNFLKLDKSFITDMESNATSYAIVESVITLGKNLGLTLIAEGVETNTQLNMLMKLNCDLVQGYLFSKPISAEQMTVLLKEANQT